MTAIASLAAAVRSVCARLAARNAATATEAMAFLDPDQRKEAGLPPGSPVQGSTSSLAGGWLH